ncbi:MAG: 3-phenylpropionate/trans-cinnamate dioxygenase ferredoxin reductase component [Miltoncostaeaceae bacterium]|nr:3-phenylpropionate/trans-cinnamate dioxygenase ferredoxin reductase component [Miltoncostaeaceae bacterium]
MAERPSHVIVGASLAGAKAAETLREEGFDGRVVLIGAEPERPYERPPLSKDYLRGESDRSKVFVHEESFYAEHDIELRTQTRVARLDVGGRAVELEGGERIGFDALLLATGAEPRRLAVPGAQLDGVLELRTLADADRLRERFARAGRLAVIGAGWIGSEAAASARQLGLEVTLIEQASVPLERVLGPEVGRIYAEIHADHGVDLRLGVGVERLEGSAAVEGVRLTDGAVVDCDLVLVGIGVVPRTGLAEAAGLEVDNGVLVSEHLEASAAGIFAAGDVANAWHPFYGRRVRVEHWANALNQGPAAARGMLGRPSPYERLPYFFSDQYEVGMEYSGLASGDDRLVLRGDPATREFIAFWLDGGRVVAGMNVNVWDVAQAIQALIRSRAEVDERRLADPSVPLEELTPAVSGGA